MLEFNPSRRLAQQDSDRVQIKIVGIGGAGLNAVDRIVLDGAAGGADLVVMNTDVQSLTGSVSTQKVQLGRGVTRGLGAGGDPELGLAAAEESQEEIRKALEGASLVFICAGLGGGTGSGAASFVAGMAREQGALVVVLATTPFTFEGRRRGQQAEEALITLQAVADAVICFDNDAMGDSVPPKAGIHQAFAAADETISQSVRSVAGLFTQPGLLHIGFDELCSALRPGASGVGRCLFGYGEAEGDNRAHDALNRALRNPLMDRGRMLQESHNVLVNVCGGPDMTLTEVQILMEALNKQIGENTQILFGAAVDPRMAGRMSVTLLSSAAIAASEPVEHVVPTRAVASVPAPRIEMPAEREEIPTVAETPAEPEEELVESEAPSLLEAVEPPAPLPVATAPRIPRQPRVLVTNKEPSVAAAAAAQKKREREERQETLQFEPVTRGRFEKSEPTIVDGQDLDVPTFLRRNVRVN